MLRGTLERLSRGIVLKRKLIAEFGKKSIFVTPEAALRYWGGGDYDPMLSKIILERIKTHDVVLDLGANVGLFSFGCAALGASVHAFEPDTFLVSLFRKSQRLNSDLDVNLYPAAVADKVGFTKLNIARRGRATNYLDVAAGSTQTGGVREVQIVPCYSVDWMVKTDELPVPNFIKIDIEGAEELALKGMAKLLDTHKPTLLCEVRESNRQRITECLINYGYELYDAENGGADISKVENILAL